MATTLISKEIDTDKIVFIDTPPKDNSARAIRIKYSYESNTEPERFIIQSAKMKAPFGISNNKIFLKKPSDTLKWDLQLSFQGEENSKPIQRFREAIERIDNRIKKECLKNGDTWIPLDDDEEEGPQKHNEKTIRKAYSSALKKFKPKKDKPNDVYSDTFKINIPWDTENNKPRSNVQFFDENQNEILWTDIVPGSDVIALFDINGLWCSRLGGGTISPSVKLIQLQFFRPKTIRGPCIRYEADDEEEDVESDEDDDLIETFEEEDSNE
jgi:hypothetical protein